MGYGDDFMEVHADSYKDYTPPVNSTSFFGRKV